MKVTLRSLELSDFDWTREIRNDNRQHFFYEKFITIKQHREWYRDNFYVISDLDFFIILVDGQRAGTISVKNNVEIGNVIFEKQYRGKNILPQVLLILNKKYNNPDFELEIRSDNDIARKAYEKNGFKITGYIMRKTKI